PRRLVGVLVIGRVAAKPQAQLASAPEGSVRRWWVRKMVEGSAPTPRGRGLSWTSEIMPWAFPRKVAASGWMRAVKRSPTPWREPDVLPDFRPLTPVFLRAFPLKDDSASAPQDQHNLI